MEGTEYLRDFGESMRRNRSLMGLSVREAAERAGISKNTILRLESGLPVQKGSLVKLSRAYGMVPVDPSEKRQQSVEGQHYRLQTRDQAVWFATKVNSEGLAESFSNPEVQTQDERNRLGWHGLASHFGQPFRVRREGTRMIPFLVEIFRATDASCDPSGERFVLGMRGDVTVHVGEESFSIREGEAATYDATLPHWIEPAKPIGRGEQAPLVLQIVLP